MIIQPDKGTRNVNGIHICLIKKKVGYKENGIAK